MKVKVKEGKFRDINGVDHKAPCVVDMPDDQAKSVSEIWPERYEIVKTKEVPNG
jgi:hypothetical protein